MSRGLSRGVSSLEFAREKITPVATGLQELRNDHMVALDLKLTSSLVDQCWGRQTDRQTD
jgi:hypothetical protein